MATIKVVLYKSKTYKDGTHPVMLQIIHDRKIRKKSLNIRLNEHEWDKQACLPKKGVQNYKSIVALIRTKIADAEKALLSIETSKEDYSVTELSTKIISKRKSISFNHLFSEIIQDMTSANRHGNASAYRSAFNAIQQFTNNKELSFTDVDYRFLKKFEDHHLGKGNTINGFNVYMRAVRAVYNRAIKENIIAAEFYPFKHYTIKQKKTVKRAISREDMQKIVNLNIESETPLWHTRNYFLFSFYTIGMSWMDMTLLKKENIYEDRIVYRRSKTKKDYTIKIYDKIQEILDYYLEQNNTYIFPIIKRTDTEINKRNNIKNELKLYNKRLKQIGKLIKCSIPLTSYVSRHSWASIANFSGIHIGVISQGLGHEDIKTTQTYLANFDHSAIDDANENIL